MRLITLEEDFPVFNPEVRLIKEFNIILTRDKGSKGDTDGRKKRIAVKELAYVHFATHYNSEFVTSYEGQERITKIKKAVGLPEDWKPDATIEAAMAVYRELNTTPTMTALSSLRDGLFSALHLIDMYRRRLDNKISIITTANVDVMDANSNAEIDSALLDYQKLIDISKKLPEQIKSIKELETSVLQEIDITKKGRKGVTVNPHEV